MTKRLFVSWGRTKPARCPRCQRTLRSCTGLSQTGPARPTPGDVTLCDECHTWLVFEPAFTLRLATAAEIATIAPELRTLAQDAAAFFTRTHKGH